MPKTRVANNVRGLDQSPSEQTTCAVIRSNALENRKMKEGTEVLEDEIFSSQVTAPVYLESSPSRLWYHRHFRSSLALLLMHH
jgi:hypothetical protein